MIGLAAGIVISMLAVTGDEIRPATLGVTSTAGSTSVGTRNSPLVPGVPGMRPLPEEAVRHTPRPAGNTLDGKVWTSTLYTVTSPLQVEWGYGQVGAQIDADSLLGTPLGVHVDGFFQQRAYHRPLRLGEPYPLSYERYVGRGDALHPRYFTYDRLTEANIALRRDAFNLAIGRSIVPFTYQSTVDGLWGDAGIMDWARLGGFAGLMPDPWHPRMWLDRDYRAFAKLLPWSDDTDDGVADPPVRLDPVIEEAEQFPGKPLRATARLLSSQTVFNVRFATVGAYFALRFARFTSDHSVQFVLFNPGSDYVYEKKGFHASPSDFLPYGGNGNLVPHRVLDAVWVNNIATWRPLNPLALYFRSSWDPWGMNRGFDLTPVVNGGFSDASVLEKTARNIMDTSLGLRELYGGFSFRGDWPFGFSVDAHHFQSLVTAESYGFYQRDLIRADAGDQIQNTKFYQNDSANASAKNRFTNLVSSKKFNMSELGVVQRERVKMAGWVSPMGFFVPASSMQVYAEGFVEWRRDFPRVSYEGEAACTLDKTGPDGTPDGVPEQYFRREDCTVCLKEEALSSGQTRTVLRFTMEECGEDGARHVARQDDHIRIGAPRGLREPTLYDHITYDFRITGIDSWSTRVLVARARVGVQAFDALTLDTSLNYEVGQNQRYYSSDVPFDAAGSRKTGPPYYPAGAASQAYLFDINALYRVAWGVTFEGSYLLMVEEQPRVQDYILGDGSLFGTPPSTVGYVPRDLYQAQQVFVLRASYRF
jgi:hypothetical protein